ncbi:eukaryotic translation initiation factor 2 alpha kinase 2 L homeolog isoform X1 [Pelobates cultripes]|uniref:Eukaryotic translation initiation factor 2 alpha kinase 2 L homeolog isoform X1 n=3 Tax=Pelobates cultripes TaxID=61616 RepID=A0AAD1RG39_PELCU|nr:eukaryotic translation initiation factor 2 alpha kinase 2 L homeolog isoform X1 [Pelobates cultripes]
MASDLNCKGALITYCLRKKIALKFDTPKQEGPSHDPKFTAHIYVNDELVGEACCGTKRMAENEAAKMALAKLQSQEQSGLPQVQPVYNPGTADQTREAEHQGSVDVYAQKNGESLDYMVIMNELSNKYQWSFTFIEVDRCGVQHAPEFSLRIKIGKTLYPIAKGKSKKQARKKAAYLALLELKNDYPKESLFQKISADVGGFVDESGSENSSVSESTGDKSADRRSSENGPAPTSSNEISFRGTSAVKSSTPGRLQSPLDDFDSITKLDSGSFGMVFKARHIVDKKFYAIKQIMLKDEKSVSEVKTLADLEHQNIVRYYHSWISEVCYSDWSCSSTERSETGSTKTWLFIKMELCDNGTLKTWIRDMKTIEKNRSLEIFRQIVDGVAYIHSKKQIHRDIKPANILFAEEGKIKIADFGLVTTMTGEHDDQALQRTQNTGTPSYMAPEQKKDTYENEVDIFPLGLILFELLWIYGSHHEKSYEWMKIRAGQLPEKFKTQNPYEESVIRKMLCEDPKGRPTACDLKKLFIENNLLVSKTV